MNLEYTFWRIISNKESDFSYKSHSLIHKTELKNEEIIKNGNKMLQDLNSLGVFK